VASLSLVTRQRSPFSGIAVNLRRTFFGFEAHSWRGIPLRFGSPFSGLLEWVSPLPWAFFEVVVQGDYHLLVGTTLLPSCCFDSG
jgi:hypothetical protein